MFEQTFKNLDDVLWKEAGCTTELDYTEQSSWLLFLKYLDDLEEERKVQADLHGKAYDYILDEPHRWSSWAAPKQQDGTLDHRKTRTGPDLIAFVDTDLFPYLPSRPMGWAFTASIWRRAPRAMSPLGPRRRSCGLRPFPHKTLGATASPPCPLSRRAATGACAIINPTPSIRRWSACRKAGGAFC
nr:type I restriction-modification system subunit M N-terminal domain-containing protein [Methylocystis bryophila]